MDNAETAQTLNTQSLFGSKTVQEKKPRNCLELLKHLKPVKNVEYKTKSPELMKYLVAIKQDTREFSLVDNIFFELSISIKIIFVNRENSSF
jgi:hypothetical protein